MNKVIFRLAYEFVEVIQLWESVSHYPRAQQSFNLDKVDLHVNRLEGKFTYGELIRLGKLAFSELSAKNDFYILVHVLLSD